MSRQAPGRLLRVEAELWGPTDRRTVRSDLPRLQVDVPADPRSAP